MACPIDNPCAQTPQHQLLISNIEKSIYNSELYQQHLDSKHIETHGFISDNR